ncbi:hypothetical protein AVEN_138833-1 [Araneus ventricosus]|uniref:Uncharacterized protein n=1 Tax=Araneus ventricosus TaxID=182803 RepID=A0A4Y2RVT8_ARAVE|nr:hypothetical protein AVEN_223992-1 [Araneus ventricosus]GBN79496.1 hypothetical protein AVEN_138833-1 [Araneus ventricosus]
MYGIPTKVKTILPRESSGTYVTPKYSRLTFGGIPYININATVYPELGTQRDPCHLWAYVEGSANRAPVGRHDLPHFCPCFRCYCPDPRAMCPKATEHRGFLGCVQLNRNWPYGESIGFMGPKGIIEFRSGEKLLVMV